MRIIVHFVPRRPKRTIIRTRHDQCQPTADHARSIASNKARSPSASSIACSPSAEAKAPPTVRPTAPLRTSRKGNRLDNGAANQVFGHVKDTDKWESRYRRGLSAKMRMSRRDGPLKNCRRFQRLASTRRASRRPRPRPANDLIGAWARARGPSNPHGTAPISVLSSQLSVRIASQALI